MRTALGKGVPDPTLNGMFREIEASGGTPRVARAARLPRFVAGRKDGAEALAALRVFLVGAGSVGSAAALHLARLGIGAMWIVDHGVFKEESLLTHPADPSWVGQGKARRIAEAVKELSPDTRVYAYSGRLESLPVGAPDVADLALLAGDNLSVESELGQRCLSLGVPLLQGSVHGETLVAQIRRFPNRDGDPCPLCLFGPLERTWLDAEPRFRCDASVGRDGPGTVETQPTRSPSFLCSLAADLLVAEVTRMAVGCDEPGAGVLEVCTFSRRSVWSPRVRREDCPGDHTPWERLELPGDLGEHTVGGVLDAASMVRTQPWSFQAQGLWFAERGGCSCGERPLGRFVDPSGTADRCPDCGELVRSGWFHSHAEATSRTLAPHLDTPVTRLGGDGCRAFVLRTRTRTVLVQGDSSHEHA